MTQAELEFAVSLRLILAGIVLSVIAIIWFGGTP
jgi:hypothetical protein